MGKSIEQHKHIAPGEYKGLWSGYFVEIVFENGSKSEKIKLDEGVRGINCKCEVIVDENGFLTVK